MNTGPQVRGGIGAVMTAFVMAAVMYLIVYRSDVLLNLKHNFEKSILLIRSATEESLEKKKELWKTIKQKDRLLYIRLRYGILGDCPHKTDAQAV